MWFFLVMIILHWRHWKFFYSFTVILKQHHWEQMSPCPLHSGLHLLVPLLMSVLLLSTGLRIWPRSRATWKQGIAFNLNQFLDWGQPVKTGFKCIQRKREMGQRQAAELHLSVGVLPHIGWMLLWNYGLPQEVCCGFSLWSHTERSWSQFYDSLFSGSSDNIYLGCSGWWGLNTQTHPDCWRSPTFVLYCKAFGPSAQDQKNSFDSLLLRGMESIRKHTVHFCFEIIPDKNDLRDKLKQKELWVWAIQRVAALFVILCPRQQLWTLTVLWCKQHKLR